MIQMCLYLICLKISSSIFIYTGYEYMLLVVVGTQDFTMFRLEIQIPSSSCLKTQVLRGPASSHHVWRWMEFYPVAWALSPSVLSLRPFCSHVLGPKKPGTSGKLYRALWRTCGMFRASRWWFTSGPGLQKWKGCIEAWESPLGNLMFFLFFVGSMGKCNVYLHLLVNNQQKM